MSLIPAFYLKLLRNLYTIDIPHVRLGSKHDGGYLIPDMIKKGTICLSPGVGDQSEFELDLANKHDSKVYICDPTVGKKWPCAHDNLSYYDIGIGYPAVGKYLPLSEWESKLVINPESNKILQMDIEGSEYDFIKNESEEYLNGFQYILIEIHNLRSLSTVTPETSQIVANMSKLFRLFFCTHIHPNNCSCYCEKNGLILYDCLELTLVNREMIHKLGAKKCTAFQKRHELDRLNSLYDYPQDWLPSITNILSSI